MAFTADEIEDGTGKSTAIVWGTSDPVAEAVAWLTKRGKTTLDGLALDADKEAALLESVRFLTTETAHRLQGRRSQRDQSLPQPRTGQYVDGYRIPSNELATVWLEAFYLAAELSASGEALGDVVDDELGLRSKGLGRGAITKSWGGAGSTNRKKYHAVLDHLALLLEPPGKLFRT